MPDDSSIDKQAIVATLWDQCRSDPGKVDVRVEVSRRYITVTTEGYGDCGNPYPQGVPILIELCGGCLRVVLWSDIANESPTHIIPLEGAKEDKRATLANESE